jgi:hypothetical protein
MGVSEADFEAALDEIMAMKVADVIRDGNASVTITCRRMMHEAITREQTRLRVQNHRNKERNAERNASGNAKVTPNKLEAISQKLETEEEKASVPAALLLASEDQPKPEKKFNAADAEIPAKLASPEFRSVWAEWCAYRREKGHTMKSRTAKAQLEKMAEWGEAQAIAAMRKSIMQGWQGVFPPTDNPNNRAPERSEFANAF